MSNNEMLTADYWIEKLALIKHPEGGYYREVYLSDDKITPQAERFSGKEYAACTAIYFLLDGESFSAFHAIKSDEIWHFYAGTAVVVYEIIDGVWQQTVLGDSSQACFQYVVKANNWFAAELLDKSSFCLIGCTVAPGFQFDDFCLADADTLKNLCSSHHQDIDRLCIVS